MARVLVALLAGLAFVACGGGDGDGDGDGRGVAHDAELRNISNVLDLRAAFNEDAGRPRLLILLSPT